MANAAYKKYFGRRYRLTITPPEGSGNALVLDAGRNSPACDIKFDVTYANGSLAREGTVSVLGLCYDTINYLLKLSAMVRGRAMAEQIHIRLDAGYFSEAGMINIFEGYVYYATIQAPPNMWVDMKVCEYNPHGEPTIKWYNDGPMDLRPLVEKKLDEFGDLNGVTFILDDETEDGLLDTEKSRTLSLSGDITLSDFIRALNEQASDKVRFLLWNRDGNNPKERHLRALDKEDEKRTKADPAIIDEKHGLLSVTGISPISGCVTTFIDGQNGNQYLSRLQLKSKLNPQANGEYLIIRKQHVGHYNGNEWFTRYYCNGKKGDSK